MRHHRSHPTGASKATGGKYMRFIITLIAVFTIAASTVSTQEKQSPAHVRDVQLVAANKKPKNEVETMLENAHKSGETIVRTCLENCDQSPAPANEEPEGFEKGRIVRLPKPSYPSLARAAQISGDVVVQVIVDLDGSVIAATVADGHPLLAAGCLRAARESMFTTSRLGGQPVKVTGVILYRFRLPSSGRT